MRAILAAATRGPYGVGGGLRVGVLGGGDACGGPRGDGMGDGGGTAMIGVGIGVGTGRGIGMPDAEDGVNAETAPAMPCAFAW